MRQQIVHPPSPPRPSPRVEIVDDRDQVWVSVREWNGKFVCDGHAVHLLYRSPFEDISLAATTLEEAVVEARTRVAEELYRLAGEIDYPFKRPANAGAVLPGGSPVDAPRRYMDAADAA